MDVGGAAALYAGTVLLRKTFEAVAQRSVSSLFSRLHVRFRGQRQLEHLQKELESRLQVLSLPVDICVHYVLLGSTALQGALDMALRVINDIISFQDELEAQAYNESIPKVSQSEAANRLEGFLSQLDSLLPYLSMAINSVSLLQRTNKSLSPSRLMEASHLIRSAGRNKGVIMSVRAKLYKYETHVTLPHWQEKLMDCNVKLRHSVSDSSAFELIVTDEHGSDSTDSTESIVLPVAEIAAIGSSTLHVLGLGEHDLEAVLLVDMDKFAKTPGVSESRTETSFTPFKDRGGKLVHYAVQCVEDNDDEGGENQDLAQLSDSESESRSYNAREGGSEFSRNVISRTRISRLSILQYALWLCMLQMREEREHWLLPDERIALFFSDPRYVSEPVLNVLKSNITGSDSGSLTPRLTPGAPRTLNRSSSSASRPSSTRSTISDIFYELNIDSPVAKP